MHKKWRVRPSSEGFSTHSDKMLRKNRKGQWSFAIPIIVFLILIAFVIITDSNQRNGLNEACQDIGYVDYVLVNERDFCKDQECNQYYVQIDREYKYLFLTKNITVKPITVGYVEVAE